MLKLLETINTNQICSCSDVFMSQLSLPTNYQECLGSQRKYLRCLGQLREGDGYREKTVYSFNGKCWCLFCFPFRQRQSISHSMTAELLFILHISDYQNVCSKYWRKSLHTGEIAGRFAPGGGPAGPEPGLRGQLRSEMSPSHVFPPLQVSL